MTKYHLTREQYEEAAKISFSIADLCRNLGILPRGGNYNTFNKNIAKYNLDVAHFSKTHHNKGKIFVENPISKGAIKLRLIEKRSHRCERCKRTEWFDIPITLELEHIDGNNTNNDKANLLLLCPNCHSQTPTWKRAKSSFLANPNKICPTCSGPKTFKAKLCVNCNKNTRTVNKIKKAKKIYHCLCGKEIDSRSKKCIKCNNIKEHKIVWPEREVLIAMLKDSSYLAVGRKLGVSDNAIRKHLK